MDGTVLVADDDRTIRTVLTQALTRAGCKVHATSSLTTLMRWVAEGRGDVIISDVVMPDGNGLEMLPKNCPRPTWAAGYCCLCSKYNYDCDSSCRSRSLRLFTQTF